MNNKPWPILVVIAAYIAIRAILFIRRRSQPQEPIDPGADRRRIMIKFAWLILLVVAMLGLLYFTPVRVTQVANPAPSAQPAIQAVTGPVARGRATS